MKMRICLILLVSFVFTSLFAQQNTYGLKENIPYYTKTTDSYQKERCVLDVYYPEKNTGSAVVIWFHGGGLSGGSKEIPVQLREKGLCVVGVNYRLTPRAKVTECVDDAAAAVAWVFKNIDKYGGDLGRIYVSGHSAGGYLAAMVGLDKSRLNRYGMDANKIAGLIPFSGQMITHFAERKSRGINDTQPVVDQLAPLYFVRPDAAPLLLITGDRELEMLGRYEENAYMMRMMKVCGHEDTHLLELQGYGHGMAEPAFPLLLNEIKRIENKKDKRE
jgi:acetyl esterase/lipase